MCIRDSFNDAYEKCRQHLAGEMVLVVSGRLQMRDQVPKILANNVIPIEQYREKNIDILRIRLDVEAARNGSLAGIAGILQAHKGSKMVEIQVVPSAGEEIRFYLGDEKKVRPGNELLRLLDRAPGVMGLEFVTDDGN